MTPGAEAVMSLEESLARLSRPPAPEPPPEHTADDQSLKLYAKARQEAIEGKTAAAITDLEAASRLDPRSPSIWRELAEANMSLGRRSAAIDAFQKALDAGSDDPRTRWILGRESLGARRFEEAAGLLADAANRAEHANDSGISALALVDLSEAMLSLGHVRASRDALEKGLSSDIRPFAQNRSRAELAELMRRTADMWLLAGDLSCRLGQYDRAADAYGHGAESSLASPYLPRLVHALLRQGRSADAGLALLENIESRAGRLTDSDLPLMRYLARSANIGPSLAAGVDGLARSLGDKAYPSVLDKLARATAASLKPEDARSLLVQHLCSRPDDQEALTDLVAMFSADEAPTACRTLVSLMHAQPRLIPSVADSLAALGRYVPQSLRALSGMREPEAAMLRAALLSRTGSEKAGAEAFDPRTMPEPLRPYALALHSRLADEAAMPEAGESDRESLGTLAEADPAARSELVRALDAADQPVAALKALQPILDGSPTYDDLLLAAELSGRNADAAGAERLLRQAATLDPADERAYEPLVNLYSPGGALASESKLTALARTVRQNAPAGRLIRSVGAREYVARSLWSQAEPMLRSLLDEHAESSPVMSLLLQTWERAGAADASVLDHAMQLIDARIADRPDAPTLLIARARLLAAQGKGDEAEKFLADALSRVAWPEVARQREAIIRDVLKKPEEASRLAVDRLRAAPLTAANAAELAGVLLTQDKADEALNVLGKAIPPGATLSPEQARVVLSTLAGIRPDTIAGTPAAGDALRLFDLVVSRSSRGGSPEMKMARLQIFAAAHADDPAALIREVDEVGAGNADQRLQGASRIADVLARRSSPASMLRFLGALAPTMGDRADTILSEWFRLTCVKGEVEDIRRLVLDAKDPLHLLKIVSSEDASEQIPDDEKRQRSLLAYDAGMLANSIRRRAQAAGAYRLALELNPDNAWAANNLGYMILEDAGDLNESERLIERAAKLLPDEASIVDSLAWVRYKRGIVRDVAGPEPKEGALSLLKRAVQLSADAPHAEIQDHYADALWRSGDHKEAINQWQLARDLTSMQLQIIPKDNHLADDTRADLQRRLDAINAKLDRAQANAEPEVEPFANQKKE